jgi:hypothetical protein
MRLDFLQGAFEWRNMRWRLPGSGHAARLPRHVWGATFADHAPKGLLRRFRNDLLFIVLICLNVAGGKR